MENQIKILHQSFKQFEVNDLLARIIGIPVISYIMFAILHMGRGDLASDLKGFLISFLYTFAYWQGLKQVWMLLQRRFPHYSQTTKRITLPIVIVLICGVFVSFIIENLA